MSPVGRRLLWVDVKLPTPNDDAASQRSLQLLSQLVRLGLAVDFAALFATEDQAGFPLNSLGINRLACADAASLVEHLSTHPDRYEIVVLCWTRVASRVLDAARSANPHAFIVFDTVDVNHVREYRQARATGNARILRRAMTTKQRELACVAAADCTLAVTEADAQTLRSGCPGARVEVVTLQAPELEPGQAANAAGRRGNLFLGNLQAAPNVDAAEHLVHDVLPELRGIGGDTLTTIVGTQPPDVVRSLANGGEVRVLGHVDDLRPVFDEHAVFVCPLRFGSGIKGKLLVAMTLGLPAVVSSVAAEGMELRHNREVLVADEPQGFAEAVVRLQRDPGLRDDIAGAALKHVRQRHSSSIVESQMRRILSAG